MLRFFGAVSMSCGHEFSGGPFTDGSPGFRLKNWSTRLTALSRLDRALLLRLQEHADLWDIPLCFASFEIAQDDDLGGKGD